MLPRPTLRYHPDGHPVLSHREIENYAEALLKDHFPARLTVPSPLTAPDLITLVHDQDGVTVERAELGSDGIRKRLGRMYLKRKHIVLDDILFTERQISLPFVTAHEVAHWLLHRDCSITSIKEREQFPDDGEDAEEIDKSVLGWSALHWLEWQASKLAGALLIPRAAAHNTIIGLQNNMGIALNRGIIFQNPTPESRAESEEQIEWVAKLFDVSKTVTRIRLADLGMYQRQVDEPVRIGRAHNPFASVTTLLGSKKR